MSMDLPSRGVKGRIAELSLWSAAGVLVLTVHIAAAALLMRDEPDAPAEDGPPAAIMIDLAPQPEAAKTDQDQVSQETQDQEEVKSEQTQPVDQAQPDPVDDPQPDPDPQPEEAAQPTPAPDPVDPPQQETAEAQPTPPDPAPEPVPVPPQVEPPPEQVQKPDPVEEQQTALLDNVEVPLPVVRPPDAQKPEDTKKAEAKKTEKKIEKARKAQQKQAQKEMAEAKLQTTQSDKTAATQTSTGSIFSSASPATWKSRVQARLARNARRCPGEGVGTAAVRFGFDNSGNVTSVSLSHSSGSSEIDDYIVSIVRRSSPIPAPPAGVPNYLVQALTCSR